MDALAAINTRRTIQSERANERQVPNAAGGYGFQIGDEARVHRFLTLGTEGGTFYATERELTKANAEIVLREAREHPQWLVDRIVEISTAGRAPRQNPAIFALAAVAGLADEQGRAAALTAMPVVCRTGTHLFLFARYIEQFRGWGPALRRAVGGWYITHEVAAVAYQAVKYRNREGWTHRDLLRLSHPVTQDPQRRALFDWITHGMLDAEHTPGVVRAFSDAQDTTTEALIQLINDHPLSWEMLPDSVLAEPKIWRALIAKGMPQTALMRQLPRLTRLGVLTGETRDTAAAQLADPQRLRKARVHPVNILVALRTYASGHSLRGESTWTPDRRIIDALDAAFYAAFTTIEPAGKRTLLALDVSGSMTYPVSGLPISCREMSAALALVTMATEPDTDVIGFTSAGGSWFSRSNTAITELPISPRQRLDDTVRAISNIPFGGTDCALPMTWALQHKREYDTIIILTDSETWAGNIHPHQALREYREKMGIPTRLAVVGLTATDISIADPADAGSLDVAGFDSAVPALIADFSRGDV